MKSVVQGKLDGSYKSASQVASIQRSISSNDIVLDLSFVPSELTLWLISKNGEDFLADFHEENALYFRGSNPVLPKSTPSRHAGLWNPGHLDDASEEVEFEQQLPSVVRPSSNRVFVIHGHNDALKERLARFLEKLGLEAVILHERPNRGETIIEKIELDSDVGFAHSSHDRRR